MATVPALVSVDVGECKGVDPMVDAHELLSEVPPQWDHPNGWHYPGKPIEEILGAK